jgi:hypothetical protein
MMAREGENGQEIPKRAGCDDARGLRGFQQGQTRIRVDDGEGGLGGAMLRQFP